MSFAFASSSHSSAAPRFVAPSSCSSSSSSSSSRKRYGEAMMKRNALFAERGGGRRRRRNIAIKAEGGGGEEATATASITNGAETKTKGATPLLVVDLEKGTVKLAKNRRKDKARIQGALAAAVKRSEVKLNDMGSTKIGPLEEDDCMDATNLVMDLFFKVRPQDFLARKRLAKAQSDRVYAGLLDGVQNSTDRVLIAAKVGSNLVGIAEVSLPNGKRFGAENYRPKAPADKPYLSDVAVATTQRGRGIGKALVLAAEECMREMGETTMYTHTKVDNKGAQKLFEKCGYAEPEWAKKGLTQAQIAQRSTEWNPFAAVGLVEVGHFMLEKPLGQ
jgi:ribosomal protein S18 acetylase RimI-like enzyme